MKKTVLAFSRIPRHGRAPAAGLQRVVPNPKLGDINAQFNEALPEAHGLIGVGRKLGRAQLEGAAKLEVVSSVSVGYDNYDLAYFNERGIALTNTPDVLTESTADLGFALIMSCARRTAELDAWTKAGQWQATVARRTSAATCMARPWASSAWATSARPSPAVAASASTCRSSTRQQPQDRAGAGTGRSSAAWMSCWPRPTSSVMVVPLSEATRNLIGARELKLMKPSAFLINIARGPVVDEAALIEALQNGTIRGAGLDVYEKSRWPIRRCSSCPMR
jgi:gluconate 2-dehydrogenase